MAAMRYGLIERLEFFKRRLWGVYRGIAEMIVKAFVSGAPRF